MELRSDYETLCERYLLGELSEAEAEQVEKTYFADDLLFERFLSVKDELLDAYARGDLKGKRLVRFEEHYLSTQARRQRVEEARELIRVTSAASKAVDRHEESGSANDRFPRWRWFARNMSVHPVMSRVGLAAALVAIVIGGWIVVRQVQDWAARRPTDEQANANPPAVPSPTPNVNSNGERASSSPSPLPSVKPGITPKATLLAPSQIASLTLLPISTRETGSANTLTLSKEQRVVRLNLVVANTGYEGFDVSVHTVEGQEVFRRGGLKASSSATGKTITITFDSSLLSRQDYIATVVGRLKNQASATVGEYYFRVQHTSPQSPAPPKQ